MMMVAAIAGSIQPKPNVSETNSLTGPTPEACAYPSVVKTTWPTMRINVHGPRVRCHAVNRSCPTSCSTQGMRAINTMLSRAA